MRVYISSPGRKVFREFAVRRPEIKLNILLTMARMPNPFEGYLEEFEPNIQSVVLDNGAFSVMNSNLGITTNQLLARFTVHTQLNNHRYLMVFSPDFDFGLQGFEENYERFLEMEDMGVVTVPVIHNLKNHEAWSYASDLPEFIAIGQSKGRLDPVNLFPLVFRLHEIRGVKVHLFGITDFSLLAGCPAFSCDSKSWLDDAITGVVRFLNTEKVGFDKSEVIYIPEGLDKKKSGMLTRYEHPSMDMFEQFIKDQLGLTIDNLISRTRGAFYRQLVQILYYHQLGEVITDIHIKHGYFF